MSGFQIRCTHKNQRKKEPSTPKLPRITSALAQGMITLIAMMLLWTSLSRCFTPTSGSGTCLAELYVDEARVSRMS